MDAELGEPPVGWGFVLGPSRVSVPVLLRDSRAAVAAPSPRLPWLLEPLQARASPCRTVPYPLHHLPPLMLSFWTVRADASYISLWQQGAAGL